MKARLFVIPGAVLLLGVLTVSADNVATTDAGRVGRTPATEISPPARKVRSEDRVTPVNALLTGRFVQTAHQSGHADIECFANTEESLDCYRPSSLDLLPVPSRESEGDHVLLGVTAPFAQIANPATERSEKPGLIDHEGLCRASRAEVPRAE